MSKTQDYTRYEYAKERLRSAMDMLVEAEDAVKRIAVREAATDYATIVLAFERLIS